MNARMNLESLESRRLLSIAIHVSGTGTTGTSNFTHLTHRGTLVFKGTAGNDVMSVTRLGRFIRIASFDESFTTTVEASKVKRILVEAGDGNDQVHIAHDLLKHVTVQGGAGNDVIDGNAGSVLIGGGGNDRLFVPDPAEYAVFDVGSPAADEAGVSVWNGAAGPATLTGGDGDDTLVAAGRDAVIGGRGNDLAIQHILDRFPGDQIPGDDLDAEAAFGERASGIESFDVVVEKWTA